MFSGPGGLQVDSVIMKLYTDWGRLLRIQGKGMKVQLIISFPMMALADTSRYMVVAYVCFLLHTLQSKTIQNFF